MTLDITQFYQTFFDEADELLADMEQLLLNLDVDQPDPEDLNAIFRAAHSIKGGAATFGFTALTQTTHILESLLDRARRNELALHKDMVDAFLETKDVLADQLADYRASREPDAQAAQTICAKLERLGQGGVLAHDAAPALELPDGVQAEAEAGIGAGVNEAGHALGANVTDAAAAADIGAAAGHAASGTPGALVPPDHVVRQALEALGADASSNGAGVAAASAASASAAGNASTAASAAGSHLNVTLIDVGDKDEQLLIEELGNLGSIVGQQRGSDRLTVTLDTDVSPDDILAVCCFVIDADQIEIAGAPSQAASADAPATRPEQDPAGAFDTAAAAQAAVPRTATALALDPGAGHTSGSMSMDGATHTTSEVTAHDAAAAAPASSGVAATAAANGAPSDAAHVTSANPILAPATATSAAATGSAARSDTGSASAEAPASAARDTARDAKPRASAAGAAEGSSIRVGVEKVDQLINLVGELVITQAMLAETANGLDPALHDRLFNGMAQLERNARDLQEAVMSIRMMPMDYVFSRFPRLVRDLASKLGKQVELVTFGQATELDKSLIERIIDPLTHLVRNSLDHGIEKVEDRLAAGKDPVGQLVLSAAHHGGNIVIEVSDDGQGLRRDKILAKAAKNGIAVSDSMTDEEVWNLIFLPGFSTAEQVTDVSGRGVGMDVVKRNIQAMGGHVEIMSQAGQGSTTRIVLPLTLAILDGMSVKVGSEIFILPLSCVMESLQPRAEDIYTVANGECVVRVRGEYLPLVALHSVFGVEGARTDPTQGIVTIMQSEGRRFAMLIDELVGQHQVVVKNLETNYRKVKGISAATILGDGSVALIVDVAALNRETRQQAGLTLH